MFTNMELFQQLVIFAMFGVLSFGLTKLIIFVFRIRQKFAFIIPVFLLIACLTFLILGLVSSLFRKKNFLQYSILTFFALLGSSIASFSYVFK